MKKVYSAQSALTVGNLRNLLVSQGIESEVRIPYLAAAGGDLPLTECWSQLWILDDADFDRAMKVISGALEPSAETYSTWKCPKCHEEVETQFDVCWQCGSFRPNGDA